MQVLLITLTLLLAIQLLTSCLLNTKQIIACEVYGIKSLYKFVHNNVTCSNVSWPLFNTTNSRNQCEGYYHCMDTTYCRNRNFDRKLKCKLYNNYLLCKCLNKRRCYHTIIQCSIIIGIKNRTIEWVPSGISEVRSLQRNRLKWIDHATSRNYIENIRKLSPLRRD